MRMRTAMHQVNNPHVDSTMPVSPTKTAPLQPTSLQPNPSQLNPTQHNHTCLHPIRPTGAIPTLPDVPEDQTSENLQPFIQPRVDMDVEMEMGMKVGESETWAWCEFHFIRFCKRSPSSRTTPSCRLEFAAASSRRARRGQRV